MNKRGDDNILKMLFEKYGDFWICFYDSEKYFNKKSKNPGWSKWRLYSNEKKKKELEGDRIYRSIFQEEIVLDVETKDKELIEKIKQNLLKNNLKFKMFSSGGKGIHFHIFFSRLKEFDKYTLPIIKKFLINLLSFNSDLADEKKKDFKNLIGVEYFKHRVGLTKTLIFETDDEIYSDNELPNAVYDFIEHLPDKQTICEVKGEFEPEIVFKDEQPCDAIKSTIKKGKESPYRNYYANFITQQLRDYCGYDFNKILNYLKIYNKNCNPPKSEDVIINDLNCSFERKYNICCNTLKNDCPFKDDMSKCPKHILFNQSLRLDEKELKEVNLIENLSSINDKLDIEFINVEESTIRDNIKEYLKQISEIKDELIRSSFLSKLSYLTKINVKDLKIEIEKIYEPNKNPTPLRELFLNYKYEPRKWLIEGILPEKGITFISAPTGRAKSFVITSLVVSMAKKNGMFLDKFKIMKRLPKTIYYDLENSKLDILDRMYFLKNGLNLSNDDYEHLLDNCELMNSFNSKDLSIEVEKCKNYDLIVLDNYRLILEGSEDKSENTNKLFKNFLHLLREEGKNIILILHEKKGSGETADSESELVISELIRGSGNIGSQPEVIWHLNKTDDEFVKGNLGLKYAVSFLKGKNRGGLGLRNFSYFVYKNDAEKKAELKFNDYRALSKYEERYRRVIDFLTNVAVAKTSDIVNLFLGEMSESNVKTTIIYKMKDRGMIKESKKGHYELPESDNLQTLKGGNNNDNGK